MKKIFLTFMILLLVVSCGKKEPSYPIYTKDEKELMYKEAKDNENQEKLKEIEDLMYKLEIEGKKEIKQHMKNFMNGMK